MILSDRQILELCKKGMISPFISKQKREGKISFGLSSFGYDIRVGNEYKIFTNINNTIVDPKNFDLKSFIDFKGSYCIIPPNSFALARSLEYFKIPNDIMGIALGKSTYARCGIVTNVTPLEPGWSGFLTIEISNTTPLPAKIYSNEGIIQIIFFKGEKPKISYNDKKGKYQNQLNITLPRI